MDGWIDIDKLNGLGGLGGLEISHHKRMDWADKLNELGGLGWIVGLEISHQKQSRGWRGNTTL